MSNKISCAQAYKVMYHFFDAIYFETYDDELGSFLGSAALYSANLGECPQTMDSAIWEDWMEAVKIVVADDFITYEFQVTIEQAHAAMHQYLITYCKIGSGPSFEILRDLIDRNIKQSKNSEWLQGRWKQSLDFILQEDAVKKIGHFFTGETELKNREAFAILQVFLDTLCQRNQDLGLIRLVQNSRLKDKSNYWADVPDIIEPEILHIWQRSVKIAFEQEDNNILTALVAYKAIPTFLMSYFDNNQSVCIDTMITKFEVQDDKMPQISFYWRSWMSALVKMNGKQTEIVHDLVSINKSISQNIALKIIKTWFQDNEDLLGVEFLECIFSDELTMHSKWQQVITSVKQKQRSYLLLDDEVTVLETYHIMLKILELHGKQFSEFEVDSIGKPVNFYIMLQWIRICEQILRIY